MARKQDSANKDALKAEVAGILAEDRDILKSIRRTCSRLIRVSGDWCRDGMSPRRIARTHVGRCRFRNAVSDNCEEP
jgi:hypothetical protein